MRGGCDSLECALCSSESTEALEIFMARTTGCPLAVYVINEFIDYLCCGISDVINILQPEVLAFGGGIAA